mgnify:CR=1 FL=1
MEPFERFSEQKLEYLRRRYRGDDLFRTWTRLLCILEQQLHGLNAVEVWSEQKWFARDCWKSRTIVIMMLSFCMEIS